MREVEHLKNDRLIFSEHFAGGDTEQQAVTDLAGCAGDCDANWGFGHGQAPVKKQWINKGLEKIHDENSVLKSTARFGQNSV